MRIGFISDTHLCDARPVRLERVAASFEWAIRDMLERKVELIIHLGDIFHKHHPSPLEHHTAARVLKQTGGVPVWLLAGNHDGARQINRPTACSMLESYARVIDRPEVLQHDDVEICCIPWASMAGLVGILGKNSGAVTNAGILVADLLHRMADDNPQSAVICGHLPFAEAMLGGERLMALSGDWSVGVHDIPEQFKLGLFGHIHRQQTISGTEHVSYVGSTSQLDFGDEDVKTSYTLAVSSGDEWLTTTVECNEGLTFRTVTPDDTPNAEEATGSIIRIVCERKPHERLDIASLIKRWENEGALEVHVRETVTDIDRGRSDVIDVDQSLTDNFLEWAKLNQLGKEKTQQLLKAIEELEEEIK